MMKWSILIFSLALLGSCGNKNGLPEGVLKPEKMQEVLWDVIRADVFTADFIKKDSAKNASAENEKLQRQIFAIHKVTGKEFYTSYNYYKSNTADFKKIIDSMIAKAERKNIIKPQTLQAE